MNSLTEPRVQYIEADLFQKGTCAFLWLARTPADDEWRDAKQFLLSIQGVKSVHLEPDFMYLPYVAVRYEGSHVFDALRNKIDAKYAYGTELVSARSYSDRLHRHIATQVVIYVRNKTVDFSALPPLTIFDMEAVEAIEGILRAEALHITWDKARPYTYCTAVYISLTKEPYNLMGAATRIASAAIKALGLFDINRAKFNRDFTVRIDPSHTLPLITAYGFSPKSNVAQGQRSTK